MWYNDSKDKTEEQEVVAMGMTMTQKILAAHAGLDSVEAGQLIEAKLDIVMANDITGPMALPIFKIGRASCRERV